MVEEIKLGCRSLKKHPSNSWGGGRRRRGITACRSEDGIGSCSYQCPTPTIYKDKAAHYVLRSNEHLRVFLPLTA